MTSGRDDSGAGGKDFPYPTGHPARQATAPLRAYNYQIWRTIHAWLELDGDELIVIEGVEDFDIVAGGDALLNQVKDKKASGAITLNSADVRDAVNNFWTARSENPKFRVRLHFLTTADVTVERGDPFGPGVSGIDLWQKCQVERDVDTASRITHQIQTYLCGSKQISLQLREWFSAASAMDVREQLILPLSWLTKQPEIDAVREAVRRKLVLECDRKGISSAEAPRVADRLHSAAWAIASQPKDRFLDRIRFLEIFDQATRVSLPLRQAEEVLRGGGSFAPAFLGILPSFVNGSGTGTRLEPTLASWEVPSSEAWLPRAALIEKLEKRLARSDVLVLAGSIGMGKSTLAALLSRTQKDGSRLWVSCRGQHPQLVQALLWAVGQEIDRRRGSVLVVVDDLDLKQDYRPFELALIGLAETVRIRGGRVVITGTDDLTHALKQRLTPSRTQCFFVPPFGEDEVEALLAARECPRDRQKDLSRVVWLRTHGHPQLVLAKLQTLSQESFPSPRVEDLVGEPFDLLDARREARRLLSTSCEPHARELLYRLSLTTGSFPRRIALEVGKAEPALEFPGDSLDALVGPWIDKSGPDDFRVSPLLTNSGQEAQNPEWAARMHGALARAWLSHRSLDQRGASAVLFHGVMAQDALSLMVIASAVLGRTEREEWHLLAEYLAWFASVPVSEQTLPESQPFERFMINLLRYRIAAESQPSATIDIYFDVISDLKEMADNEIKHQVSLFIWSFTLIATLKARNPIEVILSAILDVVRLSEELSQSTDLPQHFGSFPEFADEDGKTDITALFPVALFGRLSNPADLDLLVGWLDRLEPRLRARLLSRLEGTEHSAAIILDQVWLTEHEKGEAAVWKPVVSAAMNLANRACVWGAPKVEAAAIQMAARTLDENLKRPGEALAMVKGAIEARPSSIVLRNALAQIHYNAKEYRNALELWSDLLPSWEPLFSPGEVDLVFACQKAAESAGRLGDWRRAAGLFHRGRHWAFRLKGVRLPLALLADAGYAEYRDGQHEAFVGHLAEVLEGTLATIHAEPPTSERYKLFRLVGQMLVWIDVKTSGKELSASVDWEPLPGMCTTYSGPGMFQGVEKLSATAPEVLWGILAGNERRLCGSWSILDRKREELAASSYPAARMTVSRLSISCFHERLDVPAYAKAAAGLIRALSALRDIEVAGGGIMEKRPDPDPPADEPGVLGFWRSATLAMAIGLAARAGDCLGKLRTFVEAVHTLGLPDEVCMAVRNMIEMLDLSGPQLVARAGAEDVPVQETTMASVLLLVSHDSDAREVFTALIRVSEHFLLREGPLVPALQDDLACIVSSTCSRLASRPFALRAPKMAVPALERAADTGEVGWAKVVGLIIALNVAAGTAINPSFLARLRERAREEARAAIPSTCPRGARRGCG